MADVKISKIASEEDSYAITGLTQEEMLNYARFVGVMHEPRLYVSPRADELYKECLSSLGQDKVKSVLNVQFKVSLRDIFTTTS